MTLQAIELAPDDAGYHVTLGDALQATGDTGGARTAWQRAQTLDPRNRAARQRLNP